MATDGATPIEGWAVMDLFGHSKLAGYLTTVVIGTSGMFRVDVPAIDDDQPAYTRFIGPGAIYSFTLVTEEVARAALKRIRPEPISVYIPRQIAASSYAEDADLDEYDEEEDPC